MKKIIENILEIITEEDIEETFKKEGFIIEEIDSDEELESYSTNVNWNTIYYVEKDGKAFNVIVSGTAIAEISYERWTETFGYSVTSYNVDSTELKN